jgi:alkanesulfonate monooxygenase SsuD/methylene tetrahydromethanopterin reductase-like flavin-dependent oxidoreductase (luciferase family)
MRLGHSPLGGGATNSEIPMLPKNGEIVVSVCHVPGCVSARHLEALMPARIIGMIGVTPPQKEATLLVIEGEISPRFVAEFAQTHEAAGFDMVLVGYSSSSAEGLLVAMYAADRTERLSYLVAHRPGFVAPTLFARKVATFDQLTGGRIALHIITGKTDAEQEGDGDFTPKAERYQRAQEYLHLMKRAWASESSFDFDGHFYRVRGAHSDVRPLQEPHPLIMFGGASEGALEMGAAECDVFAIYAEPRPTTAERIADFRARAARHGRTVGFNMSVRPIIAATEGAAWDKARRILDGMTGKLGWARQEGARACRQCWPTAIRLCATEGCARRATLDGNYQGNRRAWQTPPVLWEPPSRWRTRSLTTIASASRPSSSAALIL